MLNNNKGFTLIEILLVIGFIAFAFVGVLSIAAKVEAKSSNEKINDNTPVINHSNESCGINDVLKAGCEGKVVVIDARK